jgi:ribosomal protein L11 methyltransferase
LWPALDVVGVVEPDLVLALVDDFSPTALEERGDRVRLFFPAARLRDAAVADLRSGALAGAIRVHAVDVDDEGWAERSQADLPAVTVGRLTIHPEGSARQPPRSAGLERPASRIDIVIAPSMGFGTGHHATTRLCLHALQSIDLAGASVLDVGTGSGILAIAAVRLGATRAIGVDTDPDALASARENLARNPDAAVAVELRQADATGLPRGVLSRRFDVVVANLTGVLLGRAADGLTRAVAPHGLLVVSGLLADERDEVVRACGPFTLLRETAEDGWVCLVMKNR